MYVFSFSVNSPTLYQSCGTIKLTNDNQYHAIPLAYDYELVIVLEGEFHVSDTLQKYCVKQNEFFIMSSAKIQYESSYSDCICYWMKFSFQESMDADTLKIKIPQHGKITNLDRVTIAIQQLLDANRRYHNKNYNNLLATGVLMELSNQIQLQQDNNLFSSKQKLCNYMSSYVASTAPHRISIEKIAQELGYHPKYLSTTFKNITGMPLKQYLLQEIMEHAKAELVNSRKTIAEIGLSIGYSDSHNFSHTFKKVVGLTPKEYRKNRIKPDKT